jgi:zinc protease
MKLAVVLGLLLLTAAAVPADSVLPYAHRTEVLPNGLTCVLVKLDNPDLVAYLTIVRTGSRDEVEPGHTGFAHFFEHMMFRGTPTCSAEEYNRIHTEMGADDNAFTGEDLTCYHLVFSKAHLETVVATEADRFMNLQYTEPAFQKEALAVLGEYNKDCVSPWFQLEEKFLATAFEAHTYRHTVMGFLKDVEDMPNQYTYSRQFFDRFYRPGNCIVLVVGDIDYDATLALLRKHYRDWKPGTFRPAYPTEPVQTVERACHVDYAGASLPMLWIGYQAPAFDPASRDFAALTLLARLAFGETSSIYRELVLERRTVESIEGDLASHRDPHLFTISARVKGAADREAVRARIERAIAEAVAQPVEAERLAAMKSNLKYDFLMRLDSTGGTAMGLIRILQLTGGVEALETWYATLDAVTATDIRDAARRYLVRERRTIGTLTSAGVEP